MNARWIGACRWSPRPSSVVTCLPSSSSSGVTQESTALPSTITVQAPHGRARSRISGGAEVEPAAQHIEQRRIRIGVDLMLAAIDLHRHHGFGLAGADRRASRAAPPRSERMWFRRGGHPRRFVQRRSRPAAGRGSGAQIIPAAPRSAHVHGGGKARHDRAGASPSTADTPDTARCWRGCADRARDRGCSASQIDAAIGNGRGWSRGRMRRSRRRSDAGRVGLRGRRGCRLRENACFGACGSGVGAPEISEVLSIPSVVVCHT